MSSHVMQVMLGSRDKTDWNIYDTLADAECGSTGESRGSDEQEPHSAVGAHIMQVILSSLAETGPMQLRWGMELGDL